MSEAASELWFAAIAGTMMTVVPVLVTYFVCKTVYKAKVLEREERRLMIERGMAPPAPQPLGWAAVRARELQLQFEERRLSIEKGVPLPPEPTRKPAEVLHRGLTFLALGLGLAGGYAVFKMSGFDASQTTQNWFLFFGVISPGVALYGIANIIHYRMTNASNVSND